MGKQRGTQIIGTFDNLIFYQWRGVYCVRIKGRTGTQATVAKQQAALLGQASALSGRIRKAFRPLLPGPVSRPMMYRFNNILQQWLRSGQQNSTEPVNDISFLKGFSFSPTKTGNDFHAAMPVTRSAGGSIILHIPAFDSANPIHPLPFNGRIDLHIMAVCCMLDYANDKRVFETELNIAYTGAPIPAQELILPLQTMPGCITVVAIGVNKASKGVVGALWN